MLAYFGAMLALYFLVPDAMLKDVLYPSLFGEPAAALIGWQWPEEAVAAASNRLTSARAALEIVRFCDGSGVLFIVIAAVLAFPASWRARVLGTLLGAALVYALNLLRLGGLYFVAAYHQPWFQALHTYFIPTLMIVLVALFYLGWLARVAPADRH